MKINEKEMLVNELHERLSRSKVAILTDYKGLDVTSLTNLRRELREADIEYQVVKNTLLKKASKDTDIALMEDFFKGPTAIALSFDDPVAPAKILSKFAKDNDKLEIKIGVLDGKLLEINDIEALSSLPSKDALLGQLLSVMNGVPTSFVRVLNEVPRSMLNVLQAIKDQKESA